MPNWVFNTLSVSGDKATLDEMVAQLNKPVTKHYPETNFDKELQKWVETPATQVFNNPVFSFWNVVAPTNLEAYYGEEVFKNTDTNSRDKDGKIDGVAFMAEFHRSIAEDNDWYHWNIRNWGTKWDIASADDELYGGTSMEVNDDGDVVYRFETAWSPVHEVLTKLSKMYPTLTFDYYYEEEQGWGGEDTIVNGEIIESNEWDIPNSHADNVKLDKECNCEFDDDPAYWYSDCPVDTEKYEWVDGEWVEKVSDPSAMIDLSN